MADGTIRKMIATHVYKQGVNFPDLSVVINAGGGGSDITTKQVAGRESRKTEGKERAYLIEFEHPWDVMREDVGTTKPGPLACDDRSRAKAYKQLGFEQVHVSSIEAIPWR